MNTRAFALFLCLSSAGMGASAQLSGDGDLAYSQVSGNSDGNSLALGVGLVYDSNAWQHSGDLDAYSARQAERQTAENYRLNLKTRYAYSERTYAFANGRYLTDRFSGYAYQTSVATGLGREFLNDGVTLLEGEAGIGYRISDPEGAADQDSEAILSLSAAWDRILTETTRFESDWRAELGSGNNFFQSDLAVRVAIMERLGLRVAYTVKHNSQVPAGSEKTDTRLTVGLNYSF